MPCHLVSFWVWGLDSRSRATSQHPSFPMRFSLLYKSSSSPHLWLFRNITACTLQPWHQFYPRISCFEERVARALSPGNELAQWVFLEMPAQRRGLTAIPLKQLCLSNNFFQLLIFLSWLFSLLMLWARIYKSSLCWLEWWDRPSLFDPAEIEERVPRFWPHPPTARTLRPGRLAFFRLLLIC